MVEEPVVTHGADRRGDPWLATGMDDVVASLEGPSAPSDECSIVDLRVVCGCSEDWDEDAGSATWAHGHAVPAPAPYRVGGMHDMVPKS
jgi:hypothetical protein